MKLHGCIRRLLQLAWMYSTITSACLKQHHAAKKCNDVRKTGINTILSLIRAPGHTLDTQYHCISIIKSTINKINPGQTPVDSCDELVYALTKEIQWR